MERLILVRDGYYHADARARRRAAMILAVDRGESLSTVASAGRCNRSTVRYWVRRYLHHRDVKVLVSGQSTEQEARIFRAACTLNEMKVEKRRTVGKMKKPSRLRWDERAKDLMRLDARIAPDPGDRLKAAILWAIDRGIPLSHVAHTIGHSRMSLYRVLEMANFPRKSPVKPKIRLTHKDK